MSGQTTKGGMSSTQKILIVGILVILIAVVGIGALVLKKLNQAPEALPPAPARLGDGNLVVDDSFDPEEMAKKAAENMFEVKMNATWNFPDGKSPSTDAYVANSYSNALPFYFEVLLQDTEEVVYTSPEIPLGSAVEKFSLTSDLEPGSYQAVCSYHTLNEKKEVQDTVSVTVTLNVEG